MRKWTNNMPGELISNDAHTDALPGKGIRRFVYFARVFRFRSVEFAPHIPKRNLAVEQVLGPCGPESDWIDIGHCLFRWVSPWGVAAGIDSERSKPHRNSFDYSNLTRGTQKDGSRVRDCSLISAKKLIPNAQHVNPNKKSTGATCFPPPMPPHGTTA